MQPYFTTPPLSIIDLPADAAHRGGVRTAEDIEFIIIHSTEGVDSRGWLTTDPNSKGASVHRLIRRLPGEHYKLVPDLVVANHAGFGTIGEYGPYKPKNLNWVSLGVELERYGGQGYTEWQMSELVELVLEWHGLYGPLPILSHKVVDPTRRSDPVYFNWRNFRRRLLARVHEVVLR